jgi:hypothetical protein
MKNTNFGCLVHTKETAATFQYFTRMLMSTRQFLMPISEMPGNQVAGKQTGNGFRHLVGA